MIFPARRVPLLAASLRSPMPHIRAFAVTGTLAAVLSCGFPAAGPPRETPRRVPAPRNASRVPPEEAATLRLRAPVSHYQGPEPGAPEATDLRWLLEEANRILGGKGAALAWDARLVAAAETILALPRLEGISGAGLIFALRGAGAAEPHARLLAEELPGGPPAAWRPRVLGRLLTAATAGGHTLLGGALRMSAAGRPRIALVLLRSHLRLAPIPRRPSEDASILLRGTLGAGYGAARVVVTAPDGAARSPRLVAATDGSFHAVVPLAAGAGIYQVEILGTGPSGPEVLANAPLYVGLTPPDRLLLRRRAAPVATDPARAAAELWARVLEARRQAGRTPLAWHQGLAKVAHAHAFELCRGREVRHHSAETGTASDRVTRAGLRVRWVGENVGRAPTVEEVDRELMQSPGHRATRLHAAATHGAVGVCVVERPGGVDHYVTELFVQLAPGAR